MRVKRIIPCVCIEHKPNAGDSVFYGMPELTVSGGLSGEREYWYIRCPRCHRGGLMEFRSAYYALKDWNEMQTQLWRQECTSPFDDAILESCPQWRKEMYAILMTDSASIADGTG